MGMVYAGGQHYANVDGEMVEMKYGAAREIKNAAPGERRH